MRLLGWLAATCLLALFAVEADASVVKFQGTIDAGTGGPLGTVLAGSPLTFNLTVNFDDGTGLTSNTATVTGGTFTVQSPLTNFTVVGGEILVGEGLPADAATFTVDVNGPSTGKLIFTFAANAIVDDNANQANIDALVIGNSTGFTADFTLGGGGIYTGEITGVPEPSSCLALLGLVGGGAWKWRRRRAVA